MAEAVPVARLAPRELATALREGNRAALARAVTLVESSRAQDRVAARSLFTALGPPASGTVRLGISGVPGAGKSTFIETLGVMLADAGHRVGVLAVDPSSTRTRGSVLGDLTRMPLLSQHANGYVRPSPTGGNLGGVTRTTAQAITVLEAAGFDVIIVETVGVGQSEIAVADMVDTLLLLALARAGDQLQGIKKGILEMVDVVAINKADGDGAGPAKAAARELTGALHLVRGGDQPPVLTCSGLSGAGVDDVWQAVLDHRNRLAADGLAKRRAEQQVALSWSLAREELNRRLTASTLSVRAEIETAVREGRLGAVAAADELLKAFDATGTPPAP